MIFFVKKNIVNTWRGLSSWSVNGEATDFRRWKNGDPCYAMSKHLVKKQLIWKADKASAVCNSREKVLKTKC